MSHITTEVGDSILSKTLFKGKTLEKGDSPGKEFQGFVHISRRNQTRLQADLQLNTVILHYAYQVNSVHNTLSHL